MTRTCTLRSLALAFSGLLFAYAVASAAPLLSQNFDGATFPPAGWAVNAFGSTLLNWKLNSALAESNVTGGTGTAAMAYSTGSPRATYDCALISPAISLPASARALSLQFRHRLETWSGNEVADIDVSTDGGTTWANALRWKNVKRQSGLAKVSLLPYLGKSVRIRFHYYNTTPQAWDLYWQIDDVRVGIPLVADINFDGTVDVIDLLALARSWGRSTGQQGYDTTCDLNGDGTVEVADLLLLASEWGQSS